MFRMRRGTGSTAAAYPVLGDDFPREGKFFMDNNLSQIVQTLSLTMGVAWASGINLYAAVLMLGLLGPRAT